MRLVCALRLYKHTCKAARHSQLNFMIRNLISCRDHTCIRSLVATSVRDHLVPACPHERETKCGAVPQQAAERAMNKWIATCTSGTGVTANAAVTSEGIHTLEAMVTQFREWGLRSNKAYFSCFAWWSMFEHARPQPAPAPEL